MSWRYWLSSTSLLSLDFTHPGIKHKHNSGAENVDNEIRRQIFEGIKSTDPENIALMTSNLTLDP